MKRRAYRIRYFQCPVCGKIQTASKKGHAMTEIGHVKTMLCWNCFETRDFIQVTEWESTKTETFEQRTQPEN